MSLYADQWLRITRNVIGMLMLLIFVHGCAVTPVATRSLPEPASDPVTLLTMTETLFEGIPINVSVVQFTSVVASDGAQPGAVNQVRSVESRYLPYQLKQTLDRSGYWGAVRVMPENDPGAELNVTGIIKQSDGVQLVLQITAVDATGRLWLDREFSDRAGPSDYAVDPDYRVDPFQDIFNDIANALVELRQLTPDAEVAELLDVTMLRYASGLSGAVFDRYVTQTDGRYYLAGLPARDDPLYARIQKIRESEYLFSDAVDAHYESLQRRLGPTYAWWRYYSYELIEGNRRLEGIDATRGATRGSWYAMERIYKTYKESKMNEDALRELSDSFDRETAPTVAELSGRVFRLTGTLDKQYQQWRELLRQMVAEERGL